VSRTSARLPAASRIASLLVLCLTLLACAPKLQPLGPPVMTPKLETDKLVMNDGVGLPLRHWPAEGKTKAVILAVHGFNDYSHAFEGSAQDWAKDGIETYAYDQRGFGETAHRGLWAGDRRMIDDLKAAALLLRQSHSDVPFYLLGESMGGAVVMAAAVEPDPPRADGLILVAPAVWGRRQLGPVASGALWFFAHTVPWYTLDGRGLRIEPSDNRAMLEKLFRDPLIIKATRVDTVYGLVGLMDRAVAATPDMPARTLVMFGAHEQVIDDSAALGMLRDLPRGPVGPRIAIYSQGYHMLLRDLNAHVVRQDIAAWILNPGDPLPSGAESQAQKILDLPKAGLAAGS
jgi:alpha-beta hydrolase superfamily lysophospholipase